SPATVNGIPPGQGAVLWLRRAPVTGSAGRRWSRKGAAQQRAAGTTSPRGPGPSRRDTPLGARRGPSPCRQWRLDERSLRPASDARRDPPGWDFQTQTTGRNPERTGGPPSGPLTAPREGAGG